MIPRQDLADAVWPSADAAIDPAAFHDAELLFANHKAVVVRGMLERRDEGLQFCETAVVIRRDRCSGQRPSGAALAEGAAEALRGLDASRRRHGAVRLLARIGERWVSLASADGTAPSSAPAAAAGLSFDTIDSKAA